MLWVLITSLLVQQGSASLQDARPVPATAPVQVSEAAYVDSLESAELRFFYDWVSLWHASETSRHLVVGQLNAPKPNASGDPLWRREGNGAAIAALNPQTFQRVRAENARCFRDDKNLWGPRHMIASRVGWQGVCPTWMLGRLETVDERNSIDGGLNREYRQPVDAMRRSLAAAFVAASAKFPHNDWIVGQAVRLLVDARNLDVAKSTAATCAATRWWCEVLHGYVLGARDETAAAERAFRAAVDHMPHDVRCQWTDVGVLLDSLARVAYDKGACEQQDSVNRVLWWLAYPLYSEPGNARLVEHYSRHVLVALHSSLDRDERYDWRPGTGGDALAKLIVRYGWPSYAFWEFDLVERPRNKELALHLAAFRKTNTTFEYSAERAHLIPSWNAVKDPLRATASDWTIRDPAPPENPNNSAWWPQEHSAMPIAQLPESQLAMLRRQTSVLVASAIDLDTALTRRIGGKVLSGTALSGALLLTDRPDSVDVVARGSALAGSTLVLRGAATPRPALLAVELAADTARGAAAARTRFSISPPASLATMHPGELAVSEPVVLRAPTGDDALPLDADSALALMLGSTRIANGTKIGVYWESYGFQPTDSVTLAVWIERYTPQGFMRQLGVAFKVATDLNTPVVTTWDEIALSNGAHLIAGPVSIIGRTVVLDVSKLPRGDYWLEVAIGRRGEAPLRARRTVTVQ